jgi:hypothetical protein
MRHASFVIWTAVTALSIADFLLCRRFGLSFTHWSPLLLVATLPSVALFYQFSGRSTRVAQMAQWSLLWVVFSHAAAVLTYLAAASGGRTWDAELAGIDAALGFDWPGWFEFIGRHRCLGFVLMLCYGSLIPQILISVAYFSFRDTNDVNGELLLNSIVGLLLTTAIFLLFPALGHEAVARDLYLDDLLALRSGGPLSFDMMQLKGVISFPSYHMVLAVLLTYAHRHSPLLHPIALINGIMVISIPSNGGHYLIDIVAGAAVALLAILATAATRARRGLFARATAAV